MQDSDSPVRKLNWTLPALVLDDSGVTGALVSRIVRNIGFQQVEHCMRAVDALAMLRNSKYGLLLSDLEMPEMSGLDLIRCVRGDVRIRHVPIVLMTAKLDRAADMVLRDERSGADIHILKPFTPDQLRQKLLDVFGQHPRSVVLARTRSDSRDP